MPPIDVLVPLLTSFFVTEGKEILFFLLKLILSFTSHKPLLPHNLISSSIDLKPS